LSANETNCMIAYHSVSVIYDAYQKGIRGFDANEALQAMEHSADADVRGLPAMRQYGYIPADKSSESVSQTLEVGYDDWCVAQMAKALGKNDDYKRYIELAQGYKNVYNPNNGFMQGRENGRFCIPFDPRAVTFNYTEANAWQYSFYVPHDMNGFIDLCGGKEKLAAKLDTMFTMTSVMTGRTQPDITGVVGQYAQGNEPSHHIAYLYDYLGQPWKTADYVHKIEKFYTNTPDGICGNDDCGELSAWYVMSAIGMYQVCPGDGQLCLTSPLFDTVKLHFENGKTLTISCYKETPTATYISSSARNYKSYQKSYILYDSLIKGGTLNYVLSAKPSDSWGTSNNAPADSIPASDNILPAPYTSDGSVTFKDSIHVELKSSSPLDKIYYTLDDSTPTKTSTLYTHPFSVNATCTIKSIAYRGDKHSPINISSYTRIPKGRSVKVMQEPSAQYTAGGP